MKIVNKGRGVHDREVKGLSLLQEQLPSSWTGYTNLELALPGRGREIDLILVVEDRILVVDLKDWVGPIRSEDGCWKQQSGKREVIERSPVEKIHENARALFVKLKEYLRQQEQRAGRNPKDAEIPKVSGCVVLTSCKDRSQISPTEQDSVFSIDPFIKSVRTKVKRLETFGGVAPAFHNGELLGSKWSSILARFFNAKTGPFRASARAYGAYRAKSDKPCYQHPKEIYSEFDVEDVSAKASGLLRRWDFTKADARFQTEAGRAEIAGREQKVISWLNDRNSWFESAVLQPRAGDAEYGVEYWEVFDRRRKLERLADLAVNELSDEARLDLCQQVLSHAKAMHELGVSHLDIGVHSVWAELPSTVRYSHLMGASFPELQTLGERRYQFLSSALLPENVYGEVSSGPAKDVFLLGVLAHRIVFGCPPRSEEEQPPEWDSEVDVSGRALKLHDWFQKALDWDVKARFESAVDMLQAFTNTISDGRRRSDIIQGLERFRKNIPSQRQLLRKYPEEKLLKEDERVEVWAARADGVDVVVKLWKSSCWGGCGARVGANFEFSGVC